MAINKNFVVKNGLEVSTNLILADAITNKVGIGSTIPSTQLDVIGGIACTDFRAVGVATIKTLKATTGIVTDLLATYGTVGIVTAAALQPTHVNVSGVLTAATAQFDGVTTIAVGVVTYLSGTNLNYSGIGTIQDSVITSLNVTGFSTIADLNVTGVATVATVDINAGDIEVTSVRTSNLNATGVTTITSLSVTGSTFERLTVNNYSNLAGVTTIDNATGTNLNFSGVGTITTTEATSVQSTNLNVTGVTTTNTFEASTADIDILTVNSYSNLAGVTTIDNATGTNLNFSGIGSVGGVLFSSGIITSTALGAGIVTFYGDGSQLQFLPSASPEGSDTQVQFNATGVFSGHPGFTYNYETVGATSLNVSTGATIGTDLIVSRNVKITGVATAQDFDALSDVNFKENIKTVEGALDKVEQLRGVRFNWKESGNPSYGVIAQELEEVLPELVHGSDPRTVNYNGIIGVLIEAIKELKSEIKDLKSQ